MGTALLLTAAGVLLAGTSAYASPGYTLPVADSTDPVVVGSSFSYDLTPAKDTGVQGANDTLTLTPSGASATITGATFNANPPNYSVTGSTATCTELQFIGQTRTMAVTANGAGTITAAGTSVSDRGDSDSTTVNPAGTDLSASPAESADPVNLGSTFTDTVPVTNNGPTDATGVTASILLSGASTASCPPQPPKARAASRHPRCRAPWAAWPTRQPRPSP